MTDNARPMIRTIGPGPASDASTWGVVLLAHGSQRGTDRSECSCAWADPAPEPPRWCLECPSTRHGLQSVAGRLQIALGLDPQQIILSCLEFIEPHPQRAVEMLQEQGFRRVVLLPFLLGSGKHATLELEEIIGELRVKYPEVQLYLAEGLGADPLMANLVVQRIRGMGGPSPLQPRDGQPAGILLVKAGTKTIYDDCRWLQELGTMVERRLGPGYAVSVAQSHYGDPTMPAATRHLVEQRQVSSITYVPYLFFPGLILKRNVLGGMASLRDQYPGLPMAVTPPLGPDELVVSVAAQRVRDLWARANGDGTRATALEDPAF